MAVEPRGKKMKLTKNQKGEVNMGVIAGVVVVALIVGLVIGRAIHKAPIASNSTNTSANITPTTESLNNTLVTLGIDHMTLTDQAVDAALDGSPDASALEAALYANGNSIGTAVGSVYGSAAATKFDAVWKIHLDQFVAYAVADKEGNTAAMQTALNTIQTQYTVPLSQFLAGANPNLPEATLQTDLSQHVAMTAQMIDDHVKGNYTAEASELNQGNTMITAIFSTLAGGIAKQYPTKF